MIDLKPVLFMFAATACSHPSTAAAVASATSAAEPAPASPSGKSVELPMFGLVGTISDEPDASTVHAGPLGIVTVTTSAFVVNVNVPGQFDPKTLKEAHENAASYSGKNEKSELLPDGWTLTFENGAGDGSYFANALRTITGKTFFCSTAQPKREQRDAAIAFCKSLHAK